jgi:hypothetical protein
MSMPKPSRLIVFLAVLLSGASLALAEPPQTTHVTVDVTGPVPLGMGGAAMLQRPGERAFVIETAGSFEGKVVEGAPYCAVAVTETTQTLADGNRIVRESRAPVCRDGQGRTRRELKLAAVGPLVAVRDLPERVFINDPVAGTSYVLDPDEHVARRQPRLRVIHEGTDETAKGPRREKKVHVVRKVIKHRSDAEPAEIQHDVTVTTDAGPESGPLWVEAFDLDESHAPFAASRIEKEDLGTQQMEGVEAEGSRDTLTIEAGAIGNERPIEIVSERWYSKELQVVMQSSRKDPRFGETTYRLTEVVLGEPDPSLFEVPSDYTIEEGPDKVMVQE